MSSKSRALGPVLIVILAILGWWLGSRLQFWLGLIVFLVAAAAFVMMSYRDLSPTEQERRLRWKQVRDYGKLPYIGRQLLLGLPILFVLLAIDLFGSYRSGETWHPGWFAMLFGLMIGGTVLLSLGWWHWQDRKYRNGS